MRRTVIAYSYFKRDQSILIEKKKKLKKKKEKKF